MLLNLYHKDNPQFLPLHLITSHPSTKVVSVEKKNTPHKEKKA